MKKENFKYLYSFKYKEKDYIYLTSNNYPFYFLEYDLTNKVFNYPDINIFKNLYNKFYKDNSILNYNINIKEIKRKLNNINIEINPLVRITSGLISLTLALSMCGCTQVKKETEENTTVASTYDNDLYNYFKNNNIDTIINEYDNNNYIFVKSFTNNDNKRQITLNTFDEFRTFKNINFMPTYDDVINAFIENENVNGKLLEIILEAINNMKNVEELKNIDLSVLYMNAKRMKFEYLTKEEINNNANRDSAYVYAYFDSKTGIVYLPSDEELKKFEFIHEVIGHGTLAYREENEDNLIVFDCTNYIMLNTNDTYTGYSLGVMISEGGANLIAHLVTNDYSTKTFYELYEEEIRVIARLCNVSIGELLNHKGISLYDLMYENNISTPVEYIFKMDAIYKGIMYCEFSYLMERLFIDATYEDFINSNEDKQDSIIENTIDIINDSYFKNRNELNYDYEGGSINYNFNDISNKYKEDMNKIRNK